MKNVIDFMEYKNRRHIKYMRMTEMTRILIVLIGCGGLVLIAYVFNKGGLL